MDKVNYILENASEKRRNCLSCQFEKKGKLDPVTFEDIDVYPEPTNLHDNIRFDYTYDELMKIAEDYGYSKNKELLKSFFIQAVQYCGIKVEGNEALNYVKPISGFPTGFRYCRIAGLWGTNRFTVRVVPSHWEGRFTTNFRLVGSTIKVEDHAVGELNAIFTGSSLYNLSYITENTDSELILSLNPLQKCAQDCRFCFKGSRAMTSQFRDSLINLNADELIRLIQVEYPSLDYSKLSEIVLLTGRFANKKQLIDYIQELYKGILSISNGLFNPHKNKHQRMKVSTHLLDDAEAMERVKQFGINRYIYPIEIFDNKLRNVYMSSERFPSGMNKGNVPIENVYSAIKSAGEVFGVSNVEAVVILGIDSFETTKQGLDQLNVLGIELLTYNVFRVYDVDQMEMYRLSLEEILFFQKYIDMKFGKNFIQRITKKLPQYDEKYMEIKGERK